MLARKSLTEKASLGACATLLDQQQPSVCRSQPMPRQKSSSRSWLTPQSSLLTAPEILGRELVMQVVILASSSLLIFQVGPVINL